MIRTPRVYLSGNLSCHKRLMNVNSTFMNHLTKKKATKYDKILLVYVLSLRWPNNMHVLFTYEKWIICAYYLQTPFRLKDTVLCSSNTLICFSSVYRCTYADLFFPLFNHYFLFLFVFVFVFMAQPRSMCCNLVEKCQSCSKGLC